MHPFLDPDPFVTKRPNGIKVPTEMFFYRTDRVPAAGPQPSVMGSCRATWRPRPASRAKQARTATAAITRAAVGNIAAPVILCDFRIRLSTRRQEIAQVFAPTDAAPDAAAEPALRRPAIGKETNALLA